MLNRYAAYCYKCNKRVKPQAGTLVKCQYRNTWKTKCAKCQGQKITITASIAYELANQARF